MRVSLFPLALATSLLLSQVHAFEIEDHMSFGATDEPADLSIISTADIAFFTPYIASYLERNPGISIDYTVVSSAELMRAIYHENHPFDLAISSAMDLQTKLANDGFAQPHTSSVTQTQPDWAVWNNMVFAFTQEPAAIVVSKSAFDTLPEPTSRHQLIDLMRQNSDQFIGKVGTYDVRQSGLGYLFATQDTRASETYWRLTEVMGSLDAQLYCCSSDMIDAVESGELAIAYNVLSSYALDRAETGAFSIILPSDFTTVMLRTALIPRNAPNPREAEAFLDHMLRDAFSGRSSGSSSGPIVKVAPEASVHRIQLGPGLLVYLDQLKRDAFLTEWQNAVFQD